MTAEHGSAQEECRPFLLGWKASAINSLFNSLHPGPERLQPACIPLFFALLKKAKSSCLGSDPHCPSGSPRTYWLSGVSLLTQCWLQDAAGTQLLV